MAMLLYIGKSVIPVQQSVFPTLKNSSILYGILTLVLFCLTVFKNGFKNKIIAMTGLVIFLAALFIPAWYGATGGSGEHYEQRIYFPLIGFLLFTSQINFNQNSPIFSFGTCLIILVLGFKTFSRMNVYKNEMSFIEAGLKEAPDFYFFHAVKGDKLLAQHKYSESIPFYNAAIGMQPHRHQLYSSRGYAYVELGQKNESISDFSKAIELEKNNPDLYLNRCLAYKKFGDYENATKDLSILQKNFPQTIPPGLEKDLFEELFGSMMDKVNRQIASHPENSILYIHRAKILLSNNKSNEAIRDLEYACQLDPNNEVYRKYLEQLRSRIN
jgi:tetratricopeptide (TPR) repeat protein